MRFQTNETIKSEARPRQLRENATEAERKLWLHLRNRQVLGAKFRRQHPIGNYIADFVSFDAMLIVELDGGQHAERTSYDQVRDAKLVEHGFEVLRVWNNDVFQNIEGVMSAIYTLVENRLKAPSPPNLPLKGTRLMRDHEHPQTPPRFS
jgi:very-short-patch-repair endonuclease